MVMKVLILGLVFLRPSLGIFEDCDFYEEIVPNRSYFLYSPQYPDKYPPGKSCRWYIISPPRTKIELVCEDFYIPPSQECRLDKLSISRSGRIDLADVENYCGNGKLDIVSVGNRLNVVLLTVSYSPGGSFFCHLGVKDDNPKPVPPPHPHCNCGYTNPMRIVGGTETGVNEYPMMAALIDGVEKELFCGATIISDKFALTAAHCLLQKNPRNVGLLVGDHDISTGNDTDSAKLYLTERFYLHPEYNSVSQKNDAALVAVRDKIQFSREVGPACLPFLNTRDSFAGETVHALGWGTTDFGGPTSDKLLKAPLDVITLQQCKPVYGDLITENQICTYRQDKDACQVQFRWTFTGPLKIYKAGLLKYRNIVSDSGGPLLWKDPYSGVVKILGIISYGIQCATTNPSVNTRVTSYLGWIKDTTGEDYCIV